MTETANARERHELPSAALLELVTQRMRVLAEPTRIRLLFALEDRRASVQELADELLIDHQNASKHLNVLYRTGLLSREREGSHVRYALADFTALRIIRQATDSMTGHIEELADIAGARR
jgi:DNA-binding transcriptional ArsR family regulator